MVVEWRQHGSKLASLGVGLDVDDVGLVGLRIAHHVGCAVHVLGGHGHVARLGVADKFGDEAVFHLQDVESGTGFEDDFSLADVCHTLSQSEHLVAFGAATDYAAHHGYQRLVGEVQVVFALFKVERGAFPGREATSIEECVAVLLDFDVVVTDGH